MPRKKKDCLDCNGRVKQKPVRIKASEQAPPVSYKDIEHEMAARIWRHVLYGTGTCVSYIEGVTEMPECPVQLIVALRDRLNAVIEKVNPPQPPKEVTEAWHYEPFSSGLD